MSGPGRKRVTDIPEWRSYLSLKSTLEGILEMVDVSEWTLGYEYFNLITRFQHSEQHRDPTATPITLTIGFFGASFRHSQLDTRPTVLGIPVTVDNSQPYTLDFNVSPI